MTGDGGRKELVAQRFVNSQTMLSTKPKSHGEPFGQSSLSDSDVRSDRRAVLLQIRASSLDSLALNVLLKITYGKLKTTRDPMVGNPVLLSEAVDVSSCCLQVFGGFVHVEKSFPRGSGHLCHSVLIKRLG